MVTAVATGALQVAPPILAGGLAWLARLAKPLQAAARITMPGRDGFAGRVAVEGEPGAARQAAEVHTQHRVRAFGTRNV